MNEFDFLTAIRETTIEAMRILAIRKEIDEFAFEILSVEGQI